MCIGFLLDLLGSSDYCGGHEKENRVRVRDRVRDVGYHCFTLNISVISLASRIIQRENNNRGLMIWSSDAFARRISSYSGWSNSDGSKSTIGASCSNGYVIGGSPAWLFLFADL